MSSTAPQTSNAAHTPAPIAAASGHLGVLDGWRAISILLVLGCHMLPLGPKSLRLNETAGPAGMSLFFTLSGFLICHTLWKNPDVVSFFIRRIARIMPLAVLASTTFLLIQGKPLDFFLPHWLLYTNYDHEHITKITSHFWSLCVEMHFYLFIGSLVAMTGRRGMVLIPMLALGITGLRVASGATINIMTHLRVDEILTGVTLALVWLGELGAIGRLLRTAMLRIPTAAWILLFAASCHPLSGPLQYLRPYLGTAVVGSTLLRTTNLTPILSIRPLKYIAEVSYALYVIHPATMYGWLGSGEGIEKYLKRPLSFGLTFVLAHLSTFGFEHRFTDWARRLTTKRATPVRAERTSP
jgi:peptidoglycan/LPS O-acetylase OafA/YrhL